MGHCNTKSQKEHFSARAVPMIFVTIFSGAHGMVEVEKRLRNDR
jgi:hypothetical protein